MYQVETYICSYLRVAMVRKDVDAEHHPGNHHQDGDRRRQVGVFQALLIAQRQGHDRAEDDDVPEDGGRDAQLLAPQLDAAEARNDVVGKAHVRRQQPAKEHAVDVQRAHASVGEDTERAQKLRPDKFRRDDQGDDADDEEVTDRTQQKPLHRGVLMDRLCDGLHRG